MNGSLPVYFEDGAFLFGGYRYEEHGNGIALVHPSPFDPDRMVLVYAGNSFEGAYSTFTIWTGQYDYETTRGQGTLQQEGRLCRDGEVWGFYAEWDDDYRGAWDEWRAGLEDAESEHHVFTYEPDGAADADIDTILSFQDSEYAHILSTLEVDALDEPITWYLYEDNATKGEVTGDSGNGHANPLNLEVHAVYGPDVAAIGAHEDVHVIAWYRIGDTGFALLGEGMAVMVDGEWWGEPLENWASEYRDELPSLRSLADDFWDYDEGMTYPVSGHFVAFLLDGWGIDTLKSLYVAPDLATAFEDELGLTMEEVEAAWLATIP